MKNRFQFKLNYLSALLTAALLTISVVKLDAQYATTHYIAPAPWFYFDQANEIVISTESVAAITATVSRSDGTFITNLTVSAGNPIRHRFANPACGAGCTPAHLINTTYAGRGIIVTAPAPVAVSIRNVESDQIGGGNANFIKGNASLTSFGDQGPGIEFRLGYYRSNTAGLNSVGGSPLGPVYSVMAISNNTQVFVNGATLVTLNAGESYIFQAPMGALLESSKPVVANSGQWRDTPGGCGDGVSCQIFPVPIAGNSYLIVRGNGTATTTNTILSEQSTIVATQGGGTTITVSNYDGTGALVNIVNYNLANAGSFRSIFHGNGANVYSSTLITSTKPVVVYSGTAQGCEVDMAMTPPLGGCTGSLRVETIKFRNYTNADLPYFGFVTIQSPTIPVFLNGTNLETLTGIPRFQIGTTGYYIIRFTNAQIGTPTNIVITAAAPVAASIVQQGGGFSMAGYYSSFNNTPVQPTVTASALCESSLLTAEPGLAPYQWYFEGDPIPGAIGQTHVPTLPGNYSVAGTRACGLTAPSPNINVVCTGLCQENYELSTDNLVTNGDFATQGGAVGGGITCGQSPSSTNGTTNATSLFSSQAAHCTDGALATTGCSGASNQYSLMSGSFPLNNFGFSDLLNTFPGDPAYNLPATNTYLYSNGNCYTGGEYLIWGQTLSGLVVGKSYTFYCYVNNAIEPPANSAHDPIISLRTGGSELLPNGTLVAGPSTFSEATCASTQPLGGWQRIAYTFTASTTTLVLKITSSAAGTSGDEFQLTSIGLVPCRPVVSAFSNTPVCIGSPLNLQANTFAAGAMTYSWSGPNGFTNSNQSASIPSATAAMAGTYTVTITDALGATNTATTTVVVNQPPTIALNSVTQPTCFGLSNGTINLDQALGQGPLIYTWSNSDFDNVEDPTGIVSAGTYSVILTDVNGCTATLSNIVVAQPTALAASSTFTDVTCFNACNGSINVTTTGGTAPYSYAWSGGLAAVEDPTNICVGTYSVTITDANGCTTTLSNIVISQPTALDALEAITNVTCFGACNGTIDLNVTGGIAPYTYAWSGGLGAIEDPINVCAGSYNVTATDANSCTVTLSNIVITQPAVLAASSATTNVTCFNACDGSIDITTTGGIAPYSYAWSGGLAATEDQTGVCAGTYNVTITDANGCTATLSNIIITQPAVLAASSTTTNVTCFNACDGSINVTPTGGTAPYSYTWSGGLAAVEDPTGVCAGTYNVTITDTNGCTTTLSNIVITQPAVLAASSTSTNVTCFNACDGSINVTATGGTAPYNYNWGGGITTEDRASICAGTYNVTITDANGCTVTLSNIVITQPAVLAASSTFTNITCFNACDGSINVTATGGTAPYTYNWGGGVTTEDRAGICDGTYNVTITDANGCTTTLSNIVITQPTVLAASSTSTNVTCFNACDGSIDVTATGGTAPYTYNWGGGVTTQDRTSICAGTYNVTITDANGCTVTLSNIVITQPAVLAASSTSTNVTCFNACDGSINVTATGGTAPYNYNWGGGVTTEDRAGICDGTYNVTITDANGCTTTLSNIVITQPTVLAASSTFTNVTCFNACDGSINVTTTGGTAPYTYNWGGGVTTEDRTSICAGTYNVTITDANGCTVTLSNIVITQPTVLAASSTTTNVTCFNACDGSINVTTTGGTAPYSYTWSGGLAAVEDPTGVCAGTYNVTITDINGCTTTLSNIVISQPVVLAASSTSTNVTCFNACDGSINVTTTGGTAPYTYAWSGGLGAVEDPINVCAGTYNVTITDANGCTTTLSNIVITQPAVLAASSTFTNVTCFNACNGTINVTTTGGTAPYSYNWGGGVTTEDRTSICDGTYNVTITDANGCTVTLSNIVITQPAVLAASSTFTNVTCFNACDGTINVTTTGGTAPYAYAWSGGLGIVEDPINVCAGTYNVTITDANGCTVTLSNIVITQPTVLAASSTFTNVTCFNACNGSINVTTTGGTAPYNYAWSGGLGIVEDPINVCAGTYNVTITDANGCTTTLSNIVITQPAVLAASSTFTNVTCFNACDGSINVTTTGGTAPYTYNWGGGVTTEDRTSICDGTYNVTITDANGCTTTLSNIVITQPTVLAASSTFTNVTCFNACDGTINITTTGGTTPYSYNWGGGVTTEDRTSICAGTYNVTITDANSCTVTLSNIVITQPTVLAASSTSTNVTCFNVCNGTINVTTTGGTAPYNYAWSGGLGAVEDPINVCAGTYNVTITDANGCTTTLSNIIITQPTVLAASTTSTNVTCFNACDGTINVTTTGGTAPYNYAWSGGLGAVEDPINVCAGTYNVTITDANGCTTTLSNIIITQPTVLAASSTSTNVTCFNACNGTINVTTTGGTAPYSYAWSGGLGTIEDPTSICAGTYNVTITDANGCTVTLSNIVITQPTVLAASSTFTNVTCFNACDGSINVTTTGGTAPYAYAWSGGLGIIEDPTNVCAGTYNVTITDANGCTVTLSNIVITQPAVLAASSTSTNVTCFNACDGSINVTTTGGTAPYTYNWGGGVTTEDRAGICDGTYNVTITDANGCTTTLSNIVITQPTVLAASSTFTNVTCFNACDGSINVTTTGGTAPYAYTWSGGLGIVEDPINVCAGTYNVTITDANGCTVTLSNIVITQPTVLAASSTFTNVTCFNACDGTIDVTTTGGTAPYSYAWSAGLGAVEDPTSVCAGTYNVTITDANGCTTTLSNIIITQPTVLAASSTSTNVTCFNACDGTINITTTGGTAPYNYAWSGGLGAVEDPINVCAGTYNVTITDANGCTVNLSNIVITQPAVLAASSTTTNVTCFNACDGTINVTTTGGTAPYTYAWSGGLGIVEDPINVCAGTYNVTITDANGCTTTLSNIVITQPAVLAASSTTTNVTCFNACDATINVTTTGGTAPYTYAWSGGLGAIEDPTSVCAGTYNVTITDANGCTTTLSNIIITEPTALTASSTSTNATCFNVCDGTIDVTTTGGTAPYSYAWSGGLAAVEDPTGVCAGTYNVTITDANGCTTTLSNIIITEPATLTASSTATNATCFNACNGTIDVTTTGGNAPYSYVWSGGLNPVEDPTGVCAGTYNVTITSATGCTTTLSNIVITEPTALAASSTATNATCFNACNGSINVTTTGGVAPYSYAWSGGLGTVEDPTAVCAGTYNVTITDTNGCTVTLSNIIITEPTVLAASSTSTNATCFNTCNGTINVTTTGGTAPYSYAWSGGLGTIEDPTAVCAGTYNVTITDANSCTTTLSNIVITEPTVLTASSTATNVTCINACNGSIDVTATGGTAPYSYAWSGGLGAVEDPINVCVGSYTVTITDANGCTTSISVGITEPTPIVLSTTHTNVTCFGSSNGSIDLSISGGTPGAAGYTYIWDNGATTQDLLNIPANTYCVTATDANGCTASICTTITQPTLLAVTMGNILQATCNGSCNGRATAQTTGGTVLTIYTYEWSDGQTSSTATGLCAGVYTVTVTDDNSCTATATVTITEPSGLDLNITTTNQSCFANSNDGTASATATGGVAPYSFEWSNNTVGQSITGLSTGNYTVTVTDANSCTYSEPFFIASPNPFTATSSSTNATCFGLSNGTISVNPFGGTAPYSYQWSDSQTSAMAVNIPANVTYSVTITDANGCASTVGNLSVTEPSQISSTTTVETTVSCNGEVDGSASVAVAGGTPSYNYLWDNFETSNVATALAAGTHRVTITDSNGCTAVNTVNMTEPEVLSAEISRTNVSCYGEANGAIIVDTIFGGTAPYEISLDSITWATNISAGYMYDGLDAGVYDIWVRDANGCGLYFTRTISQPVDIGLSVDGITIQLGESGELNPVVQNSSLGMIYTWSPADTTISCMNCPNPVVNPVETTVYTLTVQAVNGCTDSDTAIVVVNKGRRVFIPTAFTPNSDDNNDVFTVYGGSGVLQVKRMLIFDRWGELIFEQSNFPPADPSYGWDGTYKGRPVNPTAFVYFIEVEFVDGQVLPYKGDVSVIK